MPHASLIEHSARVCQVCINNFPLAVLSVRVKQQGKYRERKLCQILPPR
jgi:hypothetical protein